MDPKQPAQLDPKLQEAYDRVMGLTLEQPAPQPSPQPPVTTGEPTPASPTVPTHTDMPITMGAATSTPSMPAPSAMPQMSASALDAMTPTPTTPAHKKMHAFIAKKSADFKVSPVILIVGGVAFLLIYTVIWVKVFNLSVPFINP